MAEGFRIGSITVEGFKGFTKPKVIDLRNRHVFLLGRNGNGKSSVIEAIRWGLFGSTGRPRDIVANRGYTGRCRVEMSLTRDGKEWRLRRILTRGAGGDSEAALFDESGKEHPMREVLPQMDSLDAGEGTHIIFSPQSTPLRRQPEDLTPFERTVFGHLGLTHARALWSHLETALEQQTDEEASLDERVSEARKRLEGRVEELERQRGRILESPPWSSDRPPSIAETENKASELIQKMRGTSSQEGLRRLSLEALLDEAEVALEEKIGQDAKPLEEELERLDAELNRLGEVRIVWENIVGRRGDLEQERERLERHLSGVSLEELREVVEIRRQEARTLALRYRLGEIAGELVNRSESDGEVLCPICGAGWQPDQLRKNVCAMTTAQSKEESAGLRKVEDEWNEALGIERGIEELRQEVERLESEFEAMVDAEDDLEFTKALKEGCLGDRIGSVENRRDFTKDQINSFDEWISESKAELLKLRDEVQYQQLQRSLGDLQGLETELERAERDFGRVVRLGESVRDIRDAVDSTLKEELRQKVPTVAEELTSVFSALTRHPHFDKLVINEEKLPHLELGVASSSDLSGTAHPTGVLNGQAESALELVPYFALSQSEEAPTEVYLVLLDDPTRAFDREHIRILIERLVDLGKSVQVVVATQETEVFRDLLPRSFERESYVVVEPRNWSYDSGPELVAEYG